MALRAPLAVYLGKPDEGEHWARRAMQLNPDHPDWYVTNLGIALYALGRYEEAVVAYAKVAAPQIGILAGLAASYAQAGNIVGAEASRRAPARDSTRLLGATLVRFQAIPP